MRQSDLHVPELFDSQIDDMIEMPSGDQTGDDTVRWLMASSPMALRRAHGCGLHAPRLDLPTGPGIDCIWNAQSKRDTLSALARGLPVEPGKGANKIQNHRSGSDVTA